MMCPLCGGVVTAVTLDLVSHAPGFDVAYRGPGHRCMGCGQEFTGWRSALAELRALKHEARRGKFSWTDEMEAALHRYERKESAGPRR